MPNPLDYAKRESFQHACDMTIDEVRVASATLIEQLIKKYFKDLAKGPVSGDSEVDIAGDEAHQHRLLVRRGAR